MNRRAIIAASACAVLVGIGSATAWAACCETNACARAGARGCRGPACPLSLKIEATTTDADVATYKAAVLARIDETVAKAKAQSEKDACRPVTVRLIVDDGHRGPPPPKGGCGGRGRSCNGRSGERPEPPKDMPPEGEPPADHPAE